MGGFSKILNCGLQVSLQRKQGSLDDRSFLKTKYSITIGFGPKSKDYDQNGNNKFHWKVNEGAIYLQIGDLLDGYSFFYALQQIALHGEDNPIWRDKIDKNFKLSEFLYGLYDTLFGVFSKTKSNMQHLDGMYNIRKPKEETYLIYTGDKSRGDSKGLRIVYNFSDYKDPNTLKRNMALIATSKATNAKISLNMTIPQALAIAETGLNLVRFGQTLELNDQYKYSLGKMTTSIDNASLNSI